MLKYKKLENGMIEVTSTTGSVDIGEGAVIAIICTEAEKEYITESKAEKKPKE